MVAVGYFHLALEPLDKEEKGSKETSEDEIKIIVKPIAGALTLCLVFYSFWIEFKQIKSKKHKCKHFTSGFNLLDAVGLLLTLLITVHSMFNLNLISLESLGIMSAFASCFLMLKVYDWLRLFEKTSFYVKLVELTIESVGWFMILFSIALIGFGVPMSMLDMNRSAESQMIPSIFGWWFFDAFYNQYLLSLGEFASLSVAEGNSQAQLVLSFFITATFFSQITMLNMLIAIMGDSFAYATDNKDRFST